MSFFHVLIQRRLHKEIVQIEKKQTGETLPAHNLKYLAGLGRKEINQLNNPALLDAPQSSSLVPILKTSRPIWTF